MISVYGIPGCDSCRKTRKWLDDHGVAYRFHDVRETPLTASVIDNWTRQLGWDTLVNRRSTTWRGFDDATRAVIGADSVVQTLLAHPTLMKRPVIDAGGDRVLCGFDPAALERALSDTR